ncbi:MAG: GDSL-type esterase/lipase family protein [Phycisphaerales bacterium]|nr:GDSL-type esterase/lipase family protein [Phycisphaerales bacterium]
MLWAASLAGCSSPPGTSSSGGPPDQSQAASSTQGGSQPDTNVQTQADARPDAWYEPEIRAFEAADRAHPPVPGRVLFVGSSSIRMWTTLERDMRPAPVVARGFGGSKTSEVMEVFDRIVTPQEPSVIVYYCGDNDLGTDNHDSDAAAAGFIEFDRRARALWPGVQVLYIAIKPSLARWSNWDAMRRANTIVANYCAKTDGAMFLDIATPMLGKDGRPRPELFEADGLHLNAEGYALWTTVVRRAVLRAWNGGRRGEQ